MDRWVDGSGQRGGPLTTTLYTVQKFLGRGIKVVKVGERGGTRPVWSVREYTWVEVECGRCTRKNSVVDTREILSLS